MYIILRKKPSDILFSVSGPSELRALFDVYRSRDDLIRAYPEAVRGDIRRLLVWAIQSGVTVDSAKQILEPYQETLQTLLLDLTSRSEPMRAVLNTSGRSPLRSAILRVRRLPAAYHMFKARRQEWFQLIRECQEVSDNPHYAVYRQQELFYWVQIPKWLLQERSAGVRKILDIGCGFGTLALFCRRIFDCDIYCVDFKDTNLSKSVAEKSKLNFAICNIELDPFPWEDIRFDIVVLTEVLEHFNFNPLPTLTRIRSLMSDKGKLFLSTPDASRWGRLGRYKHYSLMPYPNRNLPVTDEHIYQYTLDEVKSLVEHAGFIVENEGYSPGVSARHLNLVLRCR